MYRVTLYFIENKSGTVEIRPDTDDSKATDREKSVVAICADVFLESFRGHPLVISPPSGEKK